eukprot:2524939-Rhodomonas_salina.1
MIWHSSQIHSTDDFCRILVRQGPEFRFIATTTSRIASSSRSGTSAGALGTGNIQKELLVALRPVELDQYPGTR